MDGAFAEPRPELLLSFGLGQRLPMILQTEAGECGLACLAMVAGYHGFSTDMATLRRRFSLSTHGTTLNHLVSIASRLGLSARALQFDFEALCQLETPCVLHWGMNHFVVLKAVKRARVIIHDPAVGLRQHTFAELAKHVTGIALELTPTDEFKPGEDKQQLHIKHFWSRILGLKRSLLSVLALSLLLQLFAIVSPLFMQTVVDDVLLRNDGKLLLVLAIGFGLLLTIEACVSTLRQWVILTLSSRLSMQMAANVFQHLIRLPMDYFQKRHLGDVVSRFGSLSSIQELLTTGLVTAVVDGIMVLITLVVMFVYDIRLTFIVLGVVLAYALVRVALYAPLKRMTEESIIASAQTDSTFMESIRAIQTIKLFQKENDRQNQWQNKLANTMNKGIQVEKLNISYGLVNALLFGFGNIVVIYFAADAVMAGVMSLGMLYAFMSFKERFVVAMNGLIEQAIEFKMLSVHLDRLADIVFTDKEACIDVDTAVEFDTAQQTLDVVGMGFRYGEAENAIFQNLNLSIQPGESVAIVGASGAGKSTLLKCMMGLLIPSEGDILWGGKPISKLPNYRQKIAGVMQDDQLLSGSITDNIACFEQKTDLKRIVWCAQMACIHTDIIALAMQYNTLVGDMGSGLSGGQKQRIILARALYRKPTILFMDEATSHLDINTERQVSENIATLNITRIIIAHRPETIQAANRVIEIGQC